MSDLFKELCFLAGDIGKLIELSRKKEGRHKLWKEYKEISLKIGEVSGKAFDDSNVIYRDVVDKLQELREFIHSFKEHEENLTSILLKLSHVLSEVDRFLYPQDIAGIDHRKGINHAIALK